MYFNSIAVRLCAQVSNKHKNVEVWHLLESGAYFDLNINDAALIRGRHLFEI